MRRALAIVLPLVGGSAGADAAQDRARPRSHAKAAGRRTVADRCRRRATTARTRASRSASRACCARRATRRSAGREEPLTAEEDTAKQIEKLLRGPLRYGVTGLYVADARTGEPLFAVNADDALNPASNVKMISTATALELLGPQFRYTTRVLGPEPDAGGAIHGNVYLLGSWDPTLALTDFDDIAQQLAARGVHELDGDVVVGGDPTRDGMYRALVPVEVTRAARPAKRRRSRRARRLRSRPVQGHREDRARRRASRG